MRKLITVLASGALTAGLVVAPSAIAVKAPKPVSATVSVVPTPTTVTPTTTNVTVSGNVSATSSCRKDVTGSNGDYTVVLPKPTDAAPATVLVRATVDQVLRKTGSKKKGKKNKKGRQIDCLTTTADSTPLTISE